MTVLNRNYSRFSFLDNNDYAMYFLEQIDPFELPNRKARDEKFKEIKKNLKDLSHSFSSIMLVYEKNYKTTSFNNFKSYMEYHRRVIELSIYSLDDLDHLRSIISKYIYVPEMTPIPISLQKDIKPDLQDEFIAKFIMAYLYEPLDPNDMYLFRDRSGLLKAEENGYLSSGTFDKIKEKYPISFWI